MTSSVSLLEKAREDVGPFYRVNVDGPAGMSRGARFVSADVAVGPTSVRLDRSDFPLTAVTCPRAKAPDRTGLSVTEHPVTMWLDGAVIERSHWAVGDDGWVAWVDPPGSVSVEVGVVGRCPVPPSDVSLVAD